MEIKDEVKTLKKIVVGLQIIVTAMLLLVGFLAFKYKMTDSLLTAKVAEIATKTNVEFTTETNNLFGACTVVKPLNEVK